MLWLEVNYYMKCSHNAGDGCSPKSMSYLKKSQPPPAETCQSSSSVFWFLLFTAGLQKCRNVVFWTGSHSPVLLGHFSNKVLPSPLQLVFVLFWPWSWKLARMQNLVLALGKNYFLQRERLCWSVSVLLLSRAPVICVLQQEWELGLLDAVQGWNIPSQLWAACCWSTAGWFWGCRSLCSSQWQNQPHLSCCWFLLKCKPSRLLGYSLSRDKYGWKVPQYLSVGVLVLQIDKGRNREGKMCFLKWHMIYHRTSPKKVFCRFLESLEGKEFCLRCLLQEWEMLLLSLILARWGYFALSEGMGSKWKGNLSEIWTCFPLSLETDNSRAAKSRPRCTNYPMV